MEVLFQKLERLENLIRTTQKEVLNIDEVCELTGLSKSTIYKQTMSGSIPHYKQAKHLFFDRVEVIDWLKSNRGYSSEDAINSVKMKGAVHA
ncbi:helix-turn-helix transcriptional regulator [Draconibacterium halophilum]|uniref:Helix-turn-helix domain-containing protein n=1 Tax=Draconibacterium halophilum TaxID=2706887 RepID=A0A6C0R9S2_9BACT|nr:helix-turn-helix domain-containing protein [Draconibacterium halophilum]QIA07120.1 helix-turn-helix domain-containing protein [Draconibacterium halophilum]